MVVLVQYNKGGLAKRYTVFVIKIYFCTKLYTKHNYFVNKLADLKLFNSNNRISSHELFAFGGNNKTLTSNKMLEAFISESKQHILFTGLNKTDRDTVISNSIFNLYKISIKKEHKGEQIDNIVPYFIKIMKNELINYFIESSKNSIENVLLSDINDKGIEIESDDKAYEEIFKPSQLSSKAINTALSFINNLSPKQQQIIKMQYFEGLSQKEIGASFSISPNDVKTELHRAMTKIRKALNIKKK